MAGGIRVKAHTSAGHFVKAHTRVKPVLNMRARTQYMFGHGLHTTELGVGGGRRGSKVMKIQNWKQHGMKKYGGGGGMHVWNTKTPNQKTFTTVAISRRRVQPYAMSSSSSLLGPNVETAYKNYGERAPITAPSRARLARLIRGFRNAGATRSKYSLYA